MLIFLSPHPHAPPKMEDMGKKEAESLLSRKNTVKKRHSLQTSYDN